MKKKTQSSKKFIAVVEETETGKMEEIAERLEKEGAKVDQVLSFTGIITGSTRNRQKLTKLRGIKSVEEDRDNFAL